MLLFQNGSNTGLLTKFSYSTLVILGLGLAACSGGGDNGGVFASVGGDGTEGGGGEESGEDDNGATEDEAGEGTTEDGEEGEEDEGEEEEEGGDPPKLDTGIPDVNTMTGCQVDFLFVIDNSVSMADNQNALLTSFPGFMDTIQNTLDATDDYHIMVVDTDEDTRCSPEGCANPDNWANQLCFGPQNGDACDVVLEECDTTLGAGVVHPVGGSASNEICEFQGDNRYILGNEEDDLAATFACAAQVGEAGHPSERPMDAMVAAVANEINGPGGCNDGFLRDDAILVVTFISDDPNYEDQPGPAAWKQALLDAKGGDEDAIVVLGLIPDDPGCISGNGGGAFCCQGNVCMPCNGGNNKEEGDHWQEFVESMQHGLWAEVCEDDYTPFFEQAVDLIDLSCDLNPVE